MIPLIAALLLGLAAPPAAATAVPTYTCAAAAGDPGLTVLSGDCHASPGAVTDGTFTGEAIGQVPSAALRITCTGGGTAALPAEVKLRDCIRTG